MVKLRLYGDDGPAARGARRTLHSVLETMVRLLAPFLPFVTEEVHQGLFATEPWQRSLHTLAWPEVDPAWVDPEAEAWGEQLIEIATAVRRHKSERSLSLGAELPGLAIEARDPALAAWLAEAGPDLRSVTRAREIVVGQAAGEVVFERDGLVVRVASNE
jgi:valyl-tRNA synthetase